MSFVREHTRYPIEYAVRVHCATWEDYAELYTSNLSRGGLFVAGKLTAPIGTEVLVELGLPNGSQLKLRCEVAHVVSEAEVSGGRPPGMGLMFYDLDEATRMALASMVGALKKKGQEGAPPEPEPVVEVAPLEEEPGLPAPPPIPADAARKPVFGDAVEQALFDELGRRLELPAHEQLGLEPDTPPEQIAEAHARLRERYAPHIFKRYGKATQEVLRRINDLVDGAYAQLREPAAGKVEAAATAPEVTEEDRALKARAEEARRALRATIERRMDEARTLNSGGRLDETITALEAVLTLDRKHEEARALLKAVRATRDARTAPRSGLLDKLLKR